jgi:dienelactone hydrolase
VPGARHRSVLALTLVAVVAGCGGGRHVAISVDHPVALSDVPLRIAVTGLRPHERLVVKATTVDMSGKPFTSSAPATADGNGRLVLKGERAMRIFWSVHPPASADFSYLPPRGGEAVTLSASGARTTIWRLSIAPGVRETRIRRGFYGDFFAPRNATARRAAIVVFGGSEGGLSTAGIAALYASHGYPALALAYFAEPGLPKNLVRIPLEYFANALRWVARRPGVDAKDVVVEGISRGSEAAQLVGIHYPQLVHAVVAMVPDSGSICGITRFTGVVGSARCIGPAWTFRGKAIPYASFAGPANPHPFADERIKGPILLDCGGYDHLWSSCPMADAIVGRLLAHHFRYRISLLAYPQAGHGVGALVPYAPGHLSFLDGASADANERADANGWPRLLTFLRGLADS